MKILIVLHKKDKGGGAVLQIIKLKKQMNKLGHDAKIYSIDEIKSHNLIYCIWENYKKINRMIKEFKPDIILTSEPYFTTILVLLVKNKETPIVIRIGAVFDKFYASTIHEKIFKTGKLSSLGEFIAIFLKLVAKLIFKKTKLIIFNSHFLRQKYLSIAPNTQVIHNGTEIEAKLQDINNEKLKLIYVGRIEPRKTIELIVYTLNLLQKLEINYEFSLIGDTTVNQEYWQKIKELINKKGLNGKIQPMGRVSNSKLFGILNKHDILLFPTDERNFPITEGLPNVIIEGMASGLAIISTPVAGVPEIIGSENGFIVEPASSAFANKIQYLDQNRNVLNSIKSKNIDKIKKDFDIQSTSKKYLENFQKLLRKK